MAATAQQTSQPLVSLNKIDAKRLPFPPHQPLEGCEKGSFAEATITKRLPSILAGMIKDLEASILPGLGADAKAEAQQALAALAALRQGQLDNIVLPDVVAPGGAAAAAANPALAPAIAATNEALTLWRKRVPNATWLNLPWLLIECAMYVEVAARLAAPSARLAGARIDPFAVQKAAAWAKSATAAAELAAEACRVLQRVRAQGLRGDVLKQECYAVMQYSLWGNKTDLSLLVDASAVNPVSSVGDAQGSGAGHPFVIVDEYDGAWKVLASGPPGRVDIVLDNAGLELFGDLVLADFLVESGLATEVVMHGKPFAWFVSDVVQHDFADTLAAAAPGSPAPASLPDPAAWGAVRELGARWAQHMASGKWKYTDHTFWVTPSPFCWMEAQAPDLYRALQSSRLVILKGDLNYRKLTSDCRWPTTTPFSTSLMGFEPAPLLALRTLKADVVAGLVPGQAEKLTKIDAEWLVNGRFGMLQFHKPTA